MSFGALGASTVARRLAAELTAEPAAEPDLEPESLRERQMCIGPVRPDRSFRIKYVQISCGKEEDNELV